MSDAYYSGLSSCFLTDGYKASYNSIVAEITMRFVRSESLAGAQVRRTEIIRVLGLAESELSSRVMSCFMAQAFSEQGQFPALDQTGVSVPQLRWYLVPDVVATCAKILPSDEIAVQTWLARRAR